jgi:site-specific DNA-cytosine methylase
VSGGIRWNRRISDVPDLLSSAAGIRPAQQLPVGFQCAAAIDFDDKAIATLQTNFPTLRT